MRTWPQMLRLGLIRTGTPESSRAGRSWQQATTQQSGAMPNSSRLTVPHCLTSLVWDAIEDFSPSFLSVEDLLAILERVDVTESDGGIGFEWQSPDLVNRLNSRSDLERLLSGLLEQLGGEIGDLSAGYPLDKREEAYFPAIAAAA